MGANSVNFQEAPYRGFTPITPSDTADIAGFPDNTIRGVYVLTAGNLAIRGYRDAAATVIPVTAGQIIRMSIRRIYATGTTATVAGLK